MATASFSKFVRDTGSVVRYALTTLMFGTDAAKILRIIGHADTEDTFYITNAGVFVWGPGGTTTQDTNLFRTSADVLRTDDRFIAGDGLTTKAKAGTVSDADFLHAPSSGTIAVDTTASKIWVRFGSTWKSVVLA